MIYEIYQDYNLVFYNIEYVEYLIYVEMLIWLSFFFNKKYFFENIKEIKCYYL